MQSGGEQSLVMTAEERANVIVGAALALATDGALAKALPSTIGAKATAGASVDGAGGIAVAPKTIPYEPKGSVVSQGDAPVCGPACAAMTIADKRARLLALKTRLEAL
jgi:hypothetical protein